MSRPAATAAASSRYSSFVAVAAAAAISAFFWLMASSTFGAVGASFRLAAAVGDLIGVQIGEAWNSCLVADEGV